MYRFRILQADYLLNTSVIRNDNTKSHLYSEYSLEARYVNIGERYLFTIDRTGVKLENSRSMADELMSELGDALFPVELYVTADAKIREVKNFKPIKERWKSKAQDILSRGYSLPLDRYIRLAEANFEDEEKFLNSFSRQTFIQLFFRNGAETYFSYMTRNLSRTQTVDMFTCDKMEKVNGMAIFEHLDDESSECRFEYAFSEVGDVLSVEGAIRKKGDDGKDDIYKRIDLQVVDGSRQFKKSNKLISFLVD